MIAEFDEVETPVAGSSDPVLSATTRFYAWGLDLSGTPQGAGGVGGLLLVQQTSANGDQAHLATSYDGNGNITAYLDIATGQPIDQYEYDAFGRTLGISRALEFAGTATITPPHRFSTKYTDIETGLMEYGYREYDAEKGRWLSRDPIGEIGGVNIYGMIGNKTVTWFDLLGLELSDECKCFVIKSEWAANANTLIQLGVLLRQARRLVNDIYGGMVQIPDFERIGTLGGEVQANPENEDSNCGCDTTEAAAYRTSLRSGFESLLNYEGYGSATGEGGYRLTGRGEGQAATPNQAIAYAEMMLDRVQDYDNFLAGEFKSYCISVSWSDSFYWPW